MVSGSTWAPGSTRMRMTVASVSAGIKRMRSSRGTRDPGPRTWRSRGPRFTVSVQTALSTVGIAGFRRKIKKAPRKTTIAAPRDRDTLRRIRFLRRSGREMSIEDYASTLRAANCS